MTLLVLWIAVSSYFLFNGVYVRLVAASVREVSIPAATALAEFQKERQTALQYLDDPALGPGRLQEQQKATDEKLGALKDAFAATISNAPDEIAAKVNALKSQFDQLPVLRSQISFRSIDRAQVNTYYNGVMDTASNLFDTQARVVPDAEAATGGITATSVFRAGDAMSRETSLVSTAFSAGTFAPDDFAQFAQLSGTYRTQLAQIAPFLDPGVRDQVPGAGHQRGLAAAGDRRRGDREARPVVAQRAELRAGVRNGLAERDEPGRQRPQRPRHHPGGQGFRGRDRLR